MTSPASDRRGALAIHTTDLGKRFGDRTALAGVDLEVPRGTAFGFLGANGAGKTTLIRLLLGLAQPTCGHMRVLGHDLPGERAAALARVGAIIEEPAASTARWNASGSARAATTASRATRWACASASAWRAAC